MAPPTVTLEPLRLVLVLDVSWPVAGAMAIGAIARGYGGSRLAQRVPQARVRQAIIVIGLASSVWLVTRA